MTANQTFRKQSLVQQPAKVLFVNPFSSLYGGELCLLEAATGLDRQRFVPAVVLGSEGPLADHLRAAGVTVEILGMPYMTQRGRQALHFVGGVLPAVWRLSRYIRQGQFDLVYNNILQNPYGALAARLANVPCLWHVQDMAQNRLLRLGITRMAGLLADRLVVDSKAIGKMFPNSAQKKIRLVYNGVDSKYYDPEAFDRGAARRALSIEPLQPVIGFIGRLHPNKRPQDLLHALAVIRQRWPDSLLLIAGDGELMQPLREIVLQLGLRDNVRFLGFVSDVREILSAMDVLAMPSGVEPLGRVQLEAMAMARPVVVTAAGGLPETVTAETGRIVSVGKPQELAAAVSFFLEDRERAIETGRRGRTHVLSHFTLDSYVQGLEGVLTEILSNGRASHR